MSRVLIVDDNEENCYFLQVLLTGNGFEVETARHGAEALVLARKSPPDLTVSDLLMPVMDGYTLLRHWKTDPKLKSVPFIVYTATYTEAEDERLALDLGADSFIRKPAEPDALITLIRDVQAGVAAASPTRPPNVPESEQQLLKSYSETLIRKLEEKTLQLKQANLALEQDIAERKLTEQKLRESEERFRGTFEQAAVGIAHVDTNGKFLRVNDRLCDITGYPREELIELRFLDLTVPEDRREGEEARQAMVAGKQAQYTAEKRYNRKDGREIWVNVITTPQRNAAGDPKYFISVIADITERKVLQSQLLRAQRMESIGTLAGGVAHDLNNLLSPIVMGVGVLKLKAADDISLSVIDSIERSAEHGTRLVQQVLSFARGVDGAQLAVHLGHVVREVQGFAQSSFPANIIFTVDIPNDIWLVLGDPTQLNQVLLNLCVNARDAMPEGGELHITGRNVEVDQHYSTMLETIPPGRYIHLEVTDTGVGLPPELQARVFESFFSTKEPGKGTGLGLSTSLTIVKDHGGHIGVKDTPARGTTFEIFLPAQVEISGDSQIERPKRPAPHGHGETILVVDDDLTVLEITRHTLESFGYRVVTAEDGARAMGLYAMQRHNIELVLTDLMMPVMDGMALIRALRRINPEVRVITTSGIQDQKAPLSAAGIWHNLAKPYTAEDLLITVRKALVGDRGLKLE